MKQRAAYILGNGPSLRGFNFAGNLQGRVTFGMNLAFRYWHSIGWYPTYYSCLDEVVGMCHLDDIYNLVENRAKFGIKAFFLRSKVMEALDITGLSCIDSYENLLQKHPFHFRGYWAVTGSHTLAWASWLGYRNIILLGIDGSYVKYVNNARHVDDVVLKLTASPGHNPNYFFDGYQQPGDLYHVPVQENPEIPHEYQPMSWHMLRPQLETAGAMVLNANPDSAVTAFPRVNFMDALPVLRKMRRAKKKARPPLNREFPRHTGAMLNTLGLVMDLHDKRTGLLMDIGSYHGKNCVDALSRGWKVCAVEPDEANRKILLDHLARFNGARVECDVVSCLSGRSYPWHRQKNGFMNAMQDMTGMGTRFGQITTSTIGDLMRRLDWASIDVLVLDIVGFEFMALRGLPFNANSPKCIIAAWDDSLSMQLGSDMHDMGSFLLSQGYTVFISEWHPRPAPELAPQWRRLVPYPARPEHPQAWGHFIAFHKEPPRGKFARMLRRNVSLGHPVPSPLPPLPPYKKIDHIIRF